MMQRSRFLLGRLLLVPLAVCALLLEGAVLDERASADELVMRNGKVHRGYPRREGQEIHLNVYGCSVPEMTLGVRRLRALDVRETRPHPVSDYIQGQLDELGPADVQRRIDLMRLAQSARLKAWARRLAAEVLVRQPQNAEALKVVGGAEKWKTRRQGDPRLDARLAREIRFLLRRESGASRKTEAERLEKRYGWAPGPDGIERMVRSAGGERGLRSEQALVLGAADFEGASYTLYVPEDYDPLVPRPLLIALHGGGIMKEKGASVRGSARDALAHYLEGAQELGWFLLCPDAVEAPWTTSRNAAFLEAVIAEVTSLWNVDLERVHLAGHGGGGDGAWYHGGRNADRYATVSVAAAGKPVGASSITGKTALWLYHGEEDAVVPVAPARKAAASLLRKKADFVYCELPKQGHGLAPSARRDLFRYIAPKRRRRAKAAWPRGSFSVPSSKASVAAFGDPAAAWGLGLPEDATPEELFEVLRSGRMGAEFAARRLGVKYAAAREDLAPRVRELVRDADLRADARVWAAWLCGAWKDTGAINELGDTLRTSTDERLLRHAAQAVGRIGSPDSTQDLRWALADVSKRYKALPGRTVTYQEFERACSLGAAVAEAVGLCVDEPDEVFAELEEYLVRHVLMDRREIRFAAANGEDPSRPRSQLTESMARAYKRLGAEKTLFEMLREAVKHDKAALQALVRGLAAPR